MSRADFDVVLYKCIQRMNIFNNWIGSVLVAELCVDYIVRCGEIDWLHRVGNIGGSRLRGNSDRAGVPIRQRTCNLVYGYC